MSTSADAVEARSDGGSGELAEIPTTAAVPRDSPAAAEDVDVEALDALAAALTTDHGAVDVCRRAAGFLLAYVPGSVAVQ